MPHDIGENHLQLVVGNFVELEPVLEVRDVGSEERRIPFVPVRHIEEARGDALVVACGVGLHLYEQGVDLQDEVGHVSLILPQHLVQLVQELLLQLVGRLRVLLLDRAIHHARQGYVRASIILSNTRCTF